MTLSYPSHVPSTRFPTKKNSRIANATSVRVVPHLSNELTSLPACHSSQALPWLVWLQRMDSNHRPLGYEPSQIPLLTLCFNLVRPERLELPTNGFEDRRSNPLSYGRIWYRWTISKCRPFAYQANALPLSYIGKNWRLVGESNSHKRIDNPL